MTYKTLNAELSENYKFNYNNDGQIDVYSIINHINENNLLNESQHGFISKCSCLINLL